ncbi:glutathione peroxidase [Cytophagales bacterium LB-30]|uniref:Glutathione peroxidase n=1 Tax=Shiella aurantiaca TaxID=3058365 RepID=A0ABT8F408_9BACT|nr:glutathione peroxidase [Shiella aurantiaca]MDN4164979.1 glutathione peroxidase [Shiella aurantiaca]
MKLLLILLTFFMFSFTTVKSPETPKAMSLYEFTIPSLEGDPIDFSQYKGKKLLIVNTASKCGFTPQYEDLQKLHEQYGDKLVILGFPANNFGGQEPGSNSEIASFCQKNYGVSFQMFEKVSVKGKDQHPLYKWLEEKTGEAPSWNFCKYYVSEDGQVVKFFGSRVKPMDEAILSLL